MPVLAGQRPNREPRPVSVRVQLTQRQLPEPATQQHAGQQVGHGHAEQHSVEQLVGQVVQHTRRGETLSFSLSHQQKQWKGEKKKGEGIP